jgi:NAD(P)-dependent dehydrogenase (short-subunit alcohol dehydrogenase family)
MFDLKGKTALITGSGQGIGRETALLLAAHGAKVVINWRSRDEIAMETLKELEKMGADFLTWKYDLSSDTIREDFETWAKENDVVVDILVLNASVQFRNAWENITFEEFDTQMHTNVRASLALIQSCVPAMREKKWGRIVTVGSVQQSRPNTAMAVYAATKAAQHNMVINLAKQLAPFGITVNNVAPGVIETPRNDEALKNDEYREKVLSGIPCGYFGKAEDVTAQILLLCSDEGRYITGENIFIDGGMKL